MFLIIFFLSLLFLIYLLELLSFEELDFLNDESDNDGSGSGSPGICAFPFCFVKSVVSVGKSIGGISGVGSEIFVLTGIHSIGDVFLLFVFLPRGVESKGGRIIELFWRPKF